MTRTMYDGVTPSRIPASATLVAGYADGHYANLPALRARFPHATIVSIAVSWRTRAQVLDVETGDATPAQAVTWCTQTMHDKDNSQLTVYCNQAVWPQVKEQFARARVTHPQYWIADWDGSTAIPAGAIAKQHTNTSGYDVSSVAAHWPGVDPATPAAAAKPKVSLKNLIAAAKADPPAAPRHTTHPADVKPVEAALAAEGLLLPAYAKDGSFGSLAVAAYGAWQRRLGYSGHDADGIPGETSLKALAAKHGFTVTA